MQPAGPTPARRPPSVDPGWKDELNLAEFPIAALTDRVPDGQTTLVFEDRLERRDSPPIVRRLTIMGTHKHGLPTSLDDEVLVGLIQLTKRRSNFTDAKVPFSRYELIELLGWPQSGQSYRRIEEALHRWVGVVLMYENAWWDNAAKSWVDEHFHVLDNVTLYDRERRRGLGAVGQGRPGAGPRKPDKPPLPLSSFRWNEVIFQSFQSGNLKQLDLEFYLKLRLPTTKRMFRFLDKRFYRRDRLDFDLRTLACEHIGLSRSYAPTELKRRLRPALEELEQLGFLEPLTPEERYSYVSPGTLADHPDPRPKRRRRRAGRRAGHRRTPDVGRALLDQGARRHREDRRRAGRLPSGRPDPHQGRGLRLAGPQRGQAGQQEPRRLPRRLDPGRLPTPRYPARPPRRPGRRPPPPGRGRRRKRIEADAAATPRAARREAALRRAWRLSTDPARRDHRQGPPHPGLSRWKAMMEPLCLAELARLLQAGEPIPEAREQSTSCSRTPRPEILVRPARSMRLDVRLEAIPLECRHCRQGHRGNAVPCLGLSEIAIIARLSSYMEVPR